MASIYDHVEVRDSDHPDGVYRVVGTTADTVTLLHVADADGRRLHSGRTVSVSHSTYEELPSASNPDDGGSITDVLTSLPATGYWAVRGSARQLAASPVRTLLAVAAVVVGAVGPRALSVSPLVLDGLLLGGILGLVLIGEGRV
ncbi:MAG: hypothetical protein J07HN6_02447 [Halonotius sp. J07HN6]|nr:MAG: hypothetical protein J07HN6_02447 [Halonotius sp. J07HN6]